METSAWGSIYWRVLVCQIFYNFSARVYHVFIDIIKPLFKIRLPFPKLSLVEIKAHKEIDGLATKKKSLNPQ